MKPDRRKLLLMYLGRRGLSQFTYEVTSAFMKRDDVDCLIALSSHTSEPARYKEFADKTHFVKTFKHSAGVFNLWRMWREESRLQDLVQRNGVTDILCLMPHVWSAALTGFCRSKGIGKLTIVHDASAHPGDQTAVAHFLLRRDIREASTLITLSENVTNQLLERKLATQEKILQLFHPLVGAKHGPVRRRPALGEPWRILFLGRIMAYKGLPLFVEAMEKLAQRGFAVAPGVFGEGEISAMADRLRRLGGKVVNRWLSDEEIAGALREHHILMLSNIEASQSGVLAAAHAAGLPVVACPVGGIAEQITPGQTGLLSTNISADGLADAASRLMAEPGLYEHIAQQIQTSQKGKSAEAFAERIASYLNR